MRIGLPAAILAAVAILGLALAHERRVIGPADGGQIELVVGMLDEPVFTEVRTGLDLLVRRLADGSAVEGLENSLEVTITAPGGQTRVLSVRPQFGRPGAYTDDYILTVPGTYHVRVRGFIGALEIDEVFAREVDDVESLRFP